MNLRIGEIYEVTIEKVIYGGEGLARIENRAIFVPFTAPGDRIRIKITGLEKNFARGAIEEILEASPVRREAPCKYFGSCGGCQLQHIDYDSQLKIKSEFIRESLRRIGGIKWDSEIEIFSDQEFGYRSRAEIKLSRIDHRKSGEKPQIGFFKIGSHQICEITGCPILLPAANVELQRLHQPPDLIPDWATRIYLTAGDDQVLATPATGENAREAEVDSRGVVHQNIAGFKYEFGVRTFFQSNRLLVEKLVDVATSAAQGKIAFDLYAGAGLFSLPLAQKFPRVFAVEGSRVSAGHGISNASGNNIRNIQYEILSVENWLQHKAPGLPNPDFVLLDPPRAGAGKIVVNRLSALRPSKIHYVSCDPTTLARDLKLLIEAGYKLTSLSAVDMFPQTFHIETVAKLIDDKS